MASNGEGVLLVVSATLGKSAVDGPRKDYLELQRRLNATILDRTSIAQSRVGRLLARVCGASVGQAWVAFRYRRGYRAIVTDGEHIAIPLALLLKLSRSRTRHITIGHRISASKKRPFFRWLKVQSHIDRIALHSRRQHELAAESLGISEDRLVLMPYQVDAAYWQQEPVPEERLICSAGLEFRDYPTLMRAVDGLDVKVVIGAASHWSKRRNTAEGQALPENVEVSAFDYPALRRLYSRAAIVVVPLHDTDFQAGITTILEAMAVGKPVIVTHSLGQTDVVEDRRSTTRGATPRLRPLSLVRSISEAAGVEVEATGFYVPPQDDAELKRAITYLLDHPEQRRKLGEAGRRTVERLLTVDQFADRFRRLVA